MSPFNPKQETSPILPLPRGGRVGSFGHLLLLILIMITTGTAVAQDDWLDLLDKSLFLQSSDESVRTDLSGLMDLEAFYIDQRAPGFIATDDPLYLNPRLTFFLDTRIGQHLYSFVQARVDTGFDPAYEDHTSGDFLDARADEYFLRYTPFEDARLNLQVGKSATVVGNWVARHDSWNNPLITAPLPYENISIVTDHITPATQAGFLARRNQPDQKSLWVPVIWGPSYATGASVFGQIHEFDYAVEVKNASLSSRPATWENHTAIEDTPTFSGRFGCRPDPAWNVGASASYGSYLQSGASGSLPTGKDLMDFNQITVGQDFSYAWRHWQFWGELFLSRFEVPRAGNTDTAAYYLEARYKITPELFLAARWNQQFFGEVADGTGGTQRWDRDIWRMETGIGYRFSRHLQAKLQYNYSHQNGPFQQGEQFVAAQITARF